MVLSISLWNEYSNLSHTFMMALQGGDNLLASQTMSKLIDVMENLVDSMDEKSSKDEQYNGLKI